MCSWCSATSPLLQALEMMQNLRRTRYNFLMLSHLSVTSEGLPDDANALYDLKLCITVQ